jgi:beta-glucuronidase
LYICRLIKPNKLSKQQHEKLLIFSLIFSALTVNAQQPITNIQGRENPVAQREVEVTSSISTDGVPTASVRLTKIKKPVDKSDRAEYSFDQAQSLWVPVRGMRKKRVVLLQGSNLVSPDVRFHATTEKNSRVFIYVGAANYKTDYSLNGKKLGTHEGGFTPFILKSPTWSKKKIIS